MKIYAISGLGADQRVFKFLELNYPLTHIQWVQPQKNESIEDYAFRLSDVISQGEKYGIIGVSFGGLIAIEISKILRPSFTILISSTETNSGIRPIFKLFGKLKVINLIPAMFFDPPRKLVQYFFGASNKGLLYDILDDTDVVFAKWAIIQFTTWNNQTKTSTILKISGTKDKLIPPDNDPATVLINKGEHFMIVDRAVEISKTINEWLNLSNKVL